MRQSFSDNPTLRDDLFDLLDVVFPGVREGADHARAFGAHWESVSTPYVFVHGGRVLSHVGVIGLCLVLDGRPVRVGSVHAVATHPDHRRRGHFRRLMEELLQDCERRYETLILTTENPEYYEPFGFRLVREHGFSVPCELPQRHPGGAPDRLRLLDGKAARDIALLLGLLETRAPVSEVVGVVDDTVVFCFNEGHRRLWYAEDLNAVFCFEQHERKLTLFDVVSPEIPPLAALVDRVPEAVDEVFVCFAPDRLGVSATPVPHVFEQGGPSHLMARGPFSPENRAFTLPRSART